MTISSRRHRISSYDRSEMSGSIAVAAIIAMMTAIYAVWSWLQPISLDDIGFSARYMKANGGSTSLNLGALWQFASDQWIAENGRLSNIVSPIFSVVLPRLATSLLAAMAIAAMVTLIAKLMEPERRLSPWRLATVWTVCIVAYPWHDAMLLIDYTLNYPVACMLQLALLWYVWRLNNGWGQSRRLARR